MLRPCQAGMTNENKTSPVEKFASAADTRYLAIPAAVLFSLLGSILANNLRFWLACWAKIYLYCAKLQPLNTLQVQNVLQIEMI